MTKLVSIIIPSFNRESIIKDTLDSVLRQTYSTWECIIVDDGSTDNTLNVVNEYCFKDNRFKMFSRPIESMKGAPTCRNIGIENSLGDYIIFLDSDDCLITTCLENRVLEFGRNNNNDFLVFPMAVKVNNEITIKKIEQSDSYLKDFLSYKLHWQTMCPIWKKQFIHDLKGFKEGYPRLNDPELMIRALLVPNVKFKVFTDAGYDTIYNMSVVNWVSLKDKYYQSLLLFVPEVCGNLSDGKKDYLKKYLNNYLKVWFRDFMFPSQLNLVKQNNNLINLFYKNKIISLFKMFELKCLLFGYRVLFFLERNLRNLIINIT
ncbi:glycosyltransferase [Tamlana agarivorans]|uniref:Glycosyltransferase n=1 Tax=Pseudotamlana agarivorans TaxID=481183 RepID=A0ACC5UCZ0_9FLAO|nr:glycosyltransferase family 2 protein [Tamlana agarivorans]MBU2952149.1 glycosyltransferase [Tamlana agarivorans]